MSSSSPLDDLPPEILYAILSYLPIRSLVAFGATSRSNHVFHTYSLTTLSIAVFPKPVHAMIAFLQSTSASIHHQFSRTNTTLLPHQVPIILPRPKAPISLRESRKLHPSSGSTPCEFRVRIVELQNRVFVRLIHRYALSLQDLEFFAWELTSQTAESLAWSCANVKNLALCFDHPYARHSSLPAFYFDRPGEPSTMWNALAGIGPESAQKLRMRGLESLRLERSGITEWQLRKFVEVNPRLKQLRVRKCKGVNREFVRWLGYGHVKEDGEDAEAGGKKLEVLWIEDCDELWAKSAESLGWVGGLKNLKSLSFMDCRNVDQDLVGKINTDSWHIPELIGRPPSLVSSAILEVDPACQ